MPRTYCGNETNPLTRREMLAKSGTGFGLMALAGMLSEEARAASALDPLAAREPHFKPRAKRVIFLFMHGGPSQVDTFDPKPLLTRDHGKPLPFAKPRVQFAQTGNLLKSPWEFRRYGESGLEVSDLFPHVGSCADDLCVIRSMHGSNPAHGGALLKLHTGSDVFVRPSMGSWIAYGLGTENRNLPAFVTICPTLGHGGVQNWSSAFLPAAFQGTPIGNASIPTDRAAIKDIAPRTKADLQRLQLDLVQQMNREQLAHFGHDPQLEGRIQSFELAFRMQTAAPDLMDISGETEATRKLYGLDNPVTRNFGMQCLLARRFSERGVRFVQVTHSYKWDQHGNLKADHSKNAKEVDYAIAGLLKDLKSRGMLDETLVLWAGEFGRTPTAQNDDGRDHNPHGFSLWMAGGGVKGGMAHGATDDYGYYAEVDKVDFHDLHATILHLMGIDHLRLIYRYGGRDYRLTDVFGNVIKPVLA